MKNIEKYRDELLERINVCNWYDYFNSDDCVQDCKACEERFVKWLFEDSEKPVLDEVERKYLSDVIKPFVHRVSYIVKRLNGSGYYIAIIVNNFDVMNLPYFTRNTMYKGMEVNRKYKLKELGL